MSTPPPLLQGQRILLTQADQFMGPELQRVLQSHGAQVVASTADLRPPEAAAQVVQQALAGGEVHALVANLAHPASTSNALQVDEDEWRAAFAALVDPLPRLARALLPHLAARGSGKVVVLGSASALRGMKRCSTYSAARGAQLAWVQALGVELAPQRIQVNAVAQIFVDNPDYFPPEVQANPRFQERLAREVPLGRLISAREDCEFIAYLCSRHADCFVGQVFPMCGGWVPR
jgi:2-keto-3-deoxy-L-fuconate dehydrogenase